MIRCWPYEAVILQWRTKELGTVWKSPSKQLLRRTLLLRTFSCLALGSSRRPPLPLAMLWPKKALIFTHFVPNSTLFGVGGEGSLVLVISLERSQHFCPQLSENHFVKKSGHCFVSCCTMNTLMLGLIFWRRYDVFFQTRTAILLL